MKQAPILSALFAAVLFMASCGSKSSSHLPVPKNAAFAVHINNSSLSSKLSWDEIKATNWFKEMSEKENDSLAKQLLNNPEAAGINVKEDMVFFMQKRGAVAVGVFQGSVKDAAAFEKFNQEILKKHEKNFTTKKEGDISYLKMDDNAIVSWKGSRFSYAFATDVFSKMSRSFSYNDNEDKPKKNKFGTDSLKAYIKNLYDLDSDESLANDDRYEDLLKEEGDVHFWMNNEEYYNAMTEGFMSVMSMMKLSSLFENSISATTLNFDNGQIVVKSKQYVSEEMGRLFDKHSSKNVNTAAINRIPSQNVLGVMAINCPPGAVKDLFKIIGVDGIVNSFLGRAGLSMDDFMKAYKGDMLVSFSDLGVKKETVSYGDFSHTYTKTDMKVLFALSVKDRNEFDRLVNMATEDFREDPSFKKEVSYKLGNDWFAAGNDSSYVDKFLAGGDNKMPFASKISGHPFGMYIDMQKIFTSVKETGKENVAGLDESMKTWQEVVITGGEFNNGYVRSEMVINMVDKKTNSLKQLNQYADRMATAMKNKRDEHREVIVDSTTIMAPPVESLND